MSAEEMSKLGFEIIGRKTISSEGYLTTNGVQIKSETLETLILRKRQVANENIKSQLSKN